jgi:D-threonate/D-erythronate kinase
MRNVVLIADDLTGAADSAAPFASHGLNVRLLLERSQSTEPGVTALSTESRDLDVAEVRRAVEDACHWVQRAGADSAFIFKKIDSTLRGHIIEELRVVIDRCSIQRMLLSPAFPLQGRTTRNGAQYIHDIPFSQSDFAGPEHAGDLIRLFGDISGLPVHRHPLGHVRGERRCLSKRFEAAGIHIPDIETEDDLVHVAVAALDAGISSVCGASGLARALAECLGRIAQGDFTSEILHGPALIVAGSLNRATLRQVEAIQETETPVFDISVIESRLTPVVEHLRSGDDVVISTREVPGAPRERLDIRCAIGGAVQEILSQVSPGVLALTGGDIAATVCRELGATAIKLYGEVEPGIPLGRLENGNASGLPVVTKAGGFGDRETFVRLLTSIRRK